MHLQRIQRLHDEAVGLRPAINDMNRRVIARHVAKQTEQGGFAFIVTAEFVGLHLFGMSVGKRMVPVIEVGAVPLDAVIIEPCGSKFGLETFAEAAFGLGIDVDAFGDVVCSCEILVGVNVFEVWAFERDLASAMAMGVIVAGWPLRWGGRVGVGNHSPHFPNSV